ncbi:SdpI family protein [Zobellia nedashkovskayae]|uniref:SdpI family protein n=1 Tax=Zobellia nedashkovskayae TaxID=2779510 RepID=UPI00188C739F|nr:SdpI family protein [Zobellia nedashkovskayae]
MKLSLKKELPNIIMLLLPAIYLAYIWNGLPQEVPVHWNLHGEVNRFGSKLELAITSLSMPIITYVIFLIAPFIDPKGQIKQIGAKYGNLKLFIVALLSMLAIFILYNANNSPELSPEFIVPLLGILFMVFGNYFQTIKPNYFIGIRTPWTLESPEVWKKTHRLGGQIWFVGGLVIAVCSMLIPSVYSMKIVIASFLILALIPVIYSYLYFRDIKKVV